MDDIAAIAEFIEARLAEREALAKRCRRHPGPWVHEAHSGLLPAARDIFDADGMPVAIANGSYLADHIAANDPDGVLRDVAAKRKILAEHAAVIRLAGLTAQEAGFLGWYREWVLKHLATAYSDHPGYRPEWKP